MTIQADMDQAAIFLKLEVGRYFYDHVKSELM